MLIVYYKLKKQLNLMILLNVLYCVIGLSVLTYYWIDDSIDIISSWFTLSRKEEPPLYHYDETWIKHHKRAYTQIYSVNAKQTD